jgi:hypothetical protein
MLASQNIYFRFGEIAPCWQLFLFLYGQCNIFYSIGAAFLLMRNLHLFFGPFEHSLGQQRFRAVVILINK